MWAVIAPPMMIPAIGMIAAPVKLVTRSPKMMTRTGSTPAPSATAIHVQSRRAPDSTCRREGGDHEHDNANRTANHVRLSTAAMTTETAANCAQARTVAVTREMPTPSRPIRGTPSPERQQGAERDDQRHAERRGLRHHPEDTKTRSEPTHHRQLAWSHLRDLARSLADAGCRPKPRAIAEH